MKTKKKNIINKRTNAPIQVPETATEHISLRVTPSMKEYFRNQSDNHDLSMTKYIFNIFDLHFAHHVSNEFVLDNSGYRNSEHYRAGSTKEDDSSSWDGLQKVWNFFKCV